MITLISNYKLQNKQGKIQLILGFITILFSLIGLTISYLGSIWNSHSFLNFLELTWFNYFSYFTIVTNIGCIIFLILWIVNFYKPLKIIKNGIFLTHIACYIFLCFFFYQFMFYSIIFAGEGISAFPLGTALWWVQSCILHILCPILFITFFALNIWVKKIELYNKIHYKSAVLGIILPAVYMVYLVITFFTMHYSQYGDLSAFWDFADIKNPSQVVDHSIHGSWAHLFFLPLFLTASWGALTLFYFMFNKFKQAL